MSEWGNGGHVEEDIVWCKYRSEKTCKNNVLKEYANRKYGTDLTCARAIKKLEVVTASNMDAPPRDVHSNGKHTQLSCAVAAAPY